MQYKRVSFVRDTVRFQFPVSSNGSKNWILREKSISLGLDVREVSNVMGVATFGKGKKKRILATSTFGMWTKVFATEVPKEKIVVELNSGRPRKI